MCVGEKFRVSGVLSDNGSWRMVYGRFTDDSVGEVISNKVPERVDVHKGSH